MSGRIYLIDDNSKLTPMEAAEYDSERLLQELLAKYPDLLAGEQINTDEPRRWLLVTREMAVQGEYEGAARWSLDHLFLDQDAVPTLVEVKRSSDTRIRREVVGQMLDYAANAVAYWPVEEVRAKFESNCERNDEDAEELLNSLLGEEDDIADFWQRVKTNLQAGRVRMVFLADVIPAELRRVVEFLNEQMDPAEVIAIEIRQFVGEGMKTLVPRVLGQTESARQKKLGGKSKKDKITCDEYISVFETTRTTAELKVVRRLIDWARKQNLDDNFRQGATGAAFIPILSHAHLWYYPVSIQQKGQIVIQMRWLRDHLPFNDPAKRKELFDRIGNIPGVKIMEGFPKFPIASLTDESVFQNVIGTLDWIVNEIRTSH